MTRTLQLMTGTVSTLLLAAGMAMAGGNAGSNERSFCMDVEIEPFHMLPGPMVEPEACPVRDYRDGEFQEDFYPFTIEEHLFNCDFFGDFAMLPNGDMVPSWVVSEGEDPGLPGEIKGTIDGHPFAATLLCASLTNWYQDSCTDPADPMTCTFQLAQPFIADEVPYHVRVTEVSVIDGIITVEKGKKTVEVPIVMATRAAGITHLESLDPESTQVGASITHSLLGMVTYENDEGKADDVEVLEGSVDLLLQGHIFYPDTVANDPMAARINGVICSEELYKRLNKKGKKGKDKDDD